MSLRATFFVPDDVPVCFLNKHQLKFKPAIGVNPGLAAIPQSADGFQDKLNWKALRQDVTSFSPFFWELTNKNSISLSVASGSR